MCHIGGTADATCTNSGNLATAKLSVHAGGSITVKYDMTKPEQVIVSGGLLGPYGGSTTLDPTVFKRLG